MLSTIQNSKVYRGSKRKASILAAVNKPINSELVQQIESYVDGVPISKIQKDKVEDNSEVALKDVPSNNSHDASPKESTSTRSTSASPSSRPTRSLSFHSTDFSDNSEDLSDNSDFENSDDFDDVPESKLSSEDEEEQEVEESSNLTNTSSIQASTYVTVDQVSEAANLITGMLNLVDETKGATHAAVKGGSDNELWIYYDSEVNLSSILEAVIKQINDQGYYFLEFHRVARDVNAIVFTINWLSTYFRPAQIQKESNE